MRGTTSLRFIITILLHLSVCVIGRDRHVIKFRSPNLYPDGLTWDPTSEHFIVGSLRDQTFYSISDAGVISTLLTDPTLPANSSLRLAVDSTQHRLLAAVHSVTTKPPFNAIAAYDLKSLTRIFLTHLPPSESNLLSSDMANGMAVDFDGNVYVTNSGNNFIWRVGVDGEGSIFSKAEIFTRFDPVDAGAPYANCGLSGVGYVSKGYLLVVQSNTGKMFKVNVDDGTARRVSIGEDLAGGDGLVVRKDGAAVVVTPTGSAWVVKSEDSWGRGGVADKIALTDGRDEGFPTSMTVGGGGRVYVVFGYVDEGIKGNSKESSREWFRIEEVKESPQEDYVWMFILIGLGLAYFMYWRMQMGQLIKNMDRKIE